MASLHSVNFNLDKIDEIPKDMIYKGKKGRYVRLTVAVNDEARYGNDTTIFLSPSKEETEKGAKKIYLANGRTVLTDGTAPTVKPKEKSVQAPANDKVPDLPF